MTETRTELNWFIQNLYWVRCRTESGDYFEKMQLCQLLPVILVIYAEVINMSVTHPCKLPKIGLPEIRAVTCSAAQSGSWNKQHNFA
jgi:hypothetical protein